MMTFVTIVGALAVLNLAAAHPHHGYPAIKPAACPKPPLPEIVPIVLQSVIPAPINIGPGAPGVIEHVSAPYEINYFAKPWVVKHLKSAAVNIFGQAPVVVDEYAAPAISETGAPPAVVVEEVCGAPAPVAPAHAHAPAPVYVPAPLPAPCL